MTIRYTDNSKKMIKWLRRNHGSLELASADTLNKAAEAVEKEYIRQLKTHYVLKNKYTLGSLKIFKATATRKSGAMRKITGINSIVAMRSMKGGSHYMVKQEEGARISGSSKTENRVPIPLAAARTGKNRRKPIAGRYRLMQQKPQVLRLGGQHFGQNDRFNARQRWAIMYKYRDSGKWDLTKPFIFEGTKRGLGIFAKVGARVRMLRTLKSTSVKIRARHTFENSVDVLTPDRMERIFMAQAPKYIK